MEQHIDGFEQQLVDLKNLIISHSRSRRGWPHNRPLHKREATSNATDDEFESEDNASHTT